MLIIIGSGAAGYAAAREVRALDPIMPITMITANDGCFYNKPQLSTAYRSQKTPSQLVMKTATQMAEELNITLITHTTVTRIDRDNKRIVCQQGDALVYDKLVLACGSIPITLPLMGDALDAVYQVNDLAAYTRFRERLEGGAVKKVIIIGAGLVGCEFANDLALAGFEVSVLALEPYPLARFLPPVMGQLLQQALEKIGVHFYFGVSAEEVNRSGNGVTVRLCNSDMIEADCVLSAVGIRANMQLAREAGLSCDRGIAVDKYQRCTDHTLFALGDCSARYNEVRQFIAPLLYDAKILARVLAEKEIDIDKECPASPIVLKTSVCPMVVVLLPSSDEGEWSQDKNDPNVAVCYGRDAQVIGFALAHQAMAKRPAMMARLKPRVGDCCADSAKDKSSNSRDGRTCP